MGLDDMKNKIVSISFLFIIFAFSLANIIAPDKDLSYSERRRLAQRPQFSCEELMNGKYMDGLDKYALDQFYGREMLRAVKNMVDQSVFLKLDTNKLFRADGHVFSIEYPLREDKTLALTEKLNRLYDKYLTDMNVYYAIVPDKNYHLPADGRYLRMDYERLESLMRQGLRDEMTYIDLFDALTLEDYYNTDGHWRQERLRPVLEALAKGMGLSLTFDPDSYEHKSYEPFYGAYYGQLAGMSAPDNLIWLENRLLQDAIVTALNEKGEVVEIPLYKEAGLGGMDSYDIFLSGAQPLLTLENPGGTTGRELILFRDSFGSPIAPLLLEGYDKVTVVDLRYIAPDILGSFIAFGEQDVLFLYSTIIINNSDTIQG